MNELVLGGKVYVSSKKAAEMTGYAKDYIGQLCREGRVEARLVGRSWYVLESAIKEHRFGPENGLPDGTLAIEQDEEWVGPTYQSEAPPVLATQQREEQTQHDSDPQREALQDAWQEWFSTLPKPAVEPEMLEIKSENVPIKAILHHPLEKGRSKGLLTSAKTTMPKVARDGDPAGDELSSISRVSVAVLVAVMIVVVAISTIGSGFVPKDDLKVHALNSIAGVSVYNK